MTLCWQITKQNVMQRSLFIVLLLYSYTLSCKAQSLSSTPPTFTEASLCVSELFDNLFNPNKIIKNPFASVSYNVSNSHKKVPVEVQTNEKPTNNDTSIHFDTFSVVIFYDKVTFKDALTSQKITQDEIK